VEYEETAYSAVYFSLMQEAFQWGLSLLGIWKATGDVFPSSRASGHGMKIGYHLLGQVTL